MPTVPPSARREAEGSGNARANELFGPDKAFLDADTAVAFSKQRSSLYDKLSRCESVDFSSPPTATGPNRTEARYALVVTGAARTFGETWPSLRRTWLSEPELTDLYLHVTVGEDAQPWDCLQFLGALLHPSLRSFQLRKTSVPIIQAQVEAELGSLPYDKANNNHPDGHTLAQFYQLHQSWLHVERYMRANGMRKYALVIRLRPDLYFPDRQRVLRLGFLARRLQELARTSAARHLYLTPRLIDWGGVGDQWGITDWEGGRVFHTAYANISDRYLQPVADGTIPPRWHPESFVSWQLSAHNIKHGPLESLYEGLTWNKEVAAEAGGGALDYNVGNDAVSKVIPMCLRRTFSDNECVVSPSRGGGGRFTSTYPTEYGPVVPVDFCQVKKDAEECKPKVKPAESLASKGGNAPKNDGQVV